MYILMSHQWLVLTSADVMEIFSLVNVSGQIITLIAVVVPICNFPRWQLVKTQFTSIWPFKKLFWNFEAEEISDTLYSCKWNRYHLIWCCFEDVVFFWEILLTPSWNFMTDNRNYPKVGGSHENFRVCFELQIQYHKEECICRNTMLFTKWKLIEWFLRFLILEVQKIAKIGKEMYTEIQLEQKIPMAQTNPLFRENFSTQFLITPAPWVKTGWNLHGICKWRCTTRCTNFWVTSFPYLRLINKNVIVWTFRVI